VNLGADDVEKTLEYSKKNGIDRTVVEKRGSKYWLRRDSGRCTFLTHQGRMPRCTIYAVRPVACRLYPLIPAGHRLKVDPLCPGFNKNRGTTFREFLRAQQVGKYVRKFVGKI
jgi:Fe-S-cluster containining protein